MIVELILRWRARTIGAHELSRRAADQTSPPIDRADAIESLALLVDDRRAPLVEQLAAAEALRAIAVDDTPFGAAAAAADVEAAPISPAQPLPPAMESGPTAADRARHFERLRQIRRLRRTLRRDGNRDEAAP